ncbi:MAG: SAM-dependent methyltransferase [Actinomycetes bacterium]
MASDSLTKAQVNALYYNVVGGDVFFGTEAMASPYTASVARLIAAQAAARGRTHIRILEIGANNCAFACTLLEALRELIVDGDSTLERIDYVAVEFARDSLDAAFQRERADWPKAWAGTPPSGPIGLDDSAAGSPEASRVALVGLLSDPESPQVNLGLVHAEANQFVRETAERFDVAILNELLDDLPCAVHYCDPNGHRHELAAHSHFDGDRWQVRIEATPPAEALVLPPGTITTTSKESTTLVAGLAKLLEAGGLLLAHDYGFPERFAETAQYRAPQETLPDFVSMWFPDGTGAEFPRAAFRVYGNEPKRVIQVTNDVNFSELAEALGRFGRTIVLPHGNSIAYGPNAKGLARGDGVFLSEFGLLPKDADLPELLDLLHRKQRGLRERYISTWSAGVGSVFYDLVFIKDE